MMPNHPWPLWKRAHRAQCCPVILLWWWQGVPWRTACARFHIWVWYGDSELPP